MNNTLDNFKQNYFNLTLLVIIIIGAILHIISILTIDPSKDASVYITMGRSFVEEGEFIFPWSGRYSHNYSPLLPIYLAGFYSIFGYSISISQVATLIIGLVGISIVYITTNNLFGRTPALIVTAFFAVFYRLPVATGLVFVENFLIIIFAITMWAIIKGIEDDRYMLIAGLFAGLGYLTRASIGYFFIIAVLLGFLWRFYYLRWDVFRKKWYILGGVIFLTILGIWHIRNAIHFGIANMYSDEYFNYCANYALSHPALFASIIGVKMIFILLLILILCLPMLKPLLVALNHIKDEVTSLLFISIFIVYILTVISSSIFATVESPNGPWLWENDLRYAFIAYLPILWLGVKYWNHNEEPILVKKLKLNLVKNIHIIVLIILLLITSVLFFVGLILFVLFSAAVVSFIPKQQKQRFLVFIILMCLLSAEAVTTQQHLPFVTASIDLNDKVSDNDIIAVDSDERFAFDTIWAYLETEEVELVEYTPGINSTFIVSDTNATYSNYTLIGTYEYEFENGLFASLIFSKPIFKGRGKFDEVYLWRRGG